MHSVADPEFPRGGGANSRGGHQHTILPNFPKKLHEIKRIWAPRGGARPSRPPLDPPLAFPVSFCEPRHVQTCSTLTSLHRDLPPPTPVQFKFVNYVIRTFSKRVVGVQLKYLLISFVIFRRWPVVVLISMVIVIATLLVGVIIQQR